MKTKRTHVEKGVMSQMADWLRTDPHTLPDAVTDEDLDSATESERAAVMAWRRRRARKG